MKILALSNKKGALEPIVDAFSGSHASIMAKEVSGNTWDFCREITDALQRKGYDLVVASTDDYIAADITLNKNKDIRAALCSDKYDTERVKGSSPNVILVGENLSPSALVGMVKQLYDVGSRPAEQQVQERKAKPQKEAPPQRQHPAPFARPAKEEEEPVEEEPHGPSRPGMFGKLKDALGIVEDEK